MLDVVLLHHLTDLLGVSSFSLATVGPRCKVATSGEEERKKKKKKEKATKKKKKKKKEEEEEE